MTLLAAPVSGQPQGRPRRDAERRGVRVRATAFERALPYLRMLGRSVSYVGEGEAARLVKICHNLILGVVAQILAETTVLAERGGVARADYLAFINDSVMGSTFTRYKTPALREPRLHPDVHQPPAAQGFELGLDAARQRNVPAARSPR